ncbi:hypothetical protein HG530_011798 [Fusarium avenaceum]|nr:hypothetical protein HG530_011798 [Fusarium avenaceum]
MKTSTLLAAMVPLISALTIPGFSNGAMIALQAADDMPHATSCSIFCIGLMLPKWYVRGGVGKLLVMHDATMLLMD